MDFFRRSSLSEAEIFAFFCRSHFFQPFLTTLYHSLTERKVLILACLGWRLWAGNAGAPPHVCHKLPVSLGPLCFKRNVYVFSIHFNLKDEQNPQTWGTAMISCSLNKELTWNSFSFVLLLSFWVTDFCGDHSRGRRGKPFPSTPLSPKSQKKGNFTAVVSPVYCIIWYQTWGFAWRCFNWQMCPSLPLEQVIWNIAEVSCSNMG